MPFFEIGLAEFQLYGGELALQDRHKEIAASASRFEKPRVDPLCFTTHEIEHLFDEQGGVNTSP